MLGLKLTGLLFAAALLLRLIIPARNTARRCPRCSYEMEGVPGLRCPECGKAHKRERKLLYRPRRKRAFALVALLLLIAYGGHLGGRALDDGWTTTIPSTALIAAYPRIDAAANMQPYYSMQDRLAQLQIAIPSLANSPRYQKNTADHLWFELANRASGSTQPLSDWQQHWLLDQAVSLGRRGNPMIAAAGGWSSLTNAQRSRYMDQVADQLFFPRMLTPVGAPLFAGAALPTTIANEHFTLSLRLPGNEWISRIHNPFDPMDSYFPAMYGSDSRRPAFNLGIATAPGDSVDLELKMTDDQHQFSWSRTIELAARINGTIDQVLTEYPAEEIDQWLAGWTTEGLSLIYQNKNDPSAPIESQLVLLVRNLRTARTPYTPSSSYTLVIDTEIELLAGDAVIGRGSAMWKHPLGDDPEQVPPRLINSEPVVLDEGRFREAINNNEELTVRIAATSSDRSLAALHATHRWSGVITTPLSHTWAHNARPNQADPE